mmetsp:Transcript_13765/g.35342  ORF Transcript_13765/g.35342 Transcript_13765/m.35342 type:complete len:207 (-) Transcript_13765:330-950(-)
MHGVVIETSVHNHPLVWIHVVQLVEDKSRLTRTGCTDKHDGLANLHEHVNEEADACCLRRVDHRCRNRLFGIVLEIRNLVRPRAPLLLLRVDIPVVHSARLGKGDGLEFRDPPLGELFSPIDKLVLKEGTPKSPDAAPHEVELVVILGAAVRCILLRQKQAQERRQRVDHGVLGNRCNRFEPLLHRVETRWNVLLEQHHQVGALVG